TDRRHWRPPGLTRIPDGRLTVKVAEGSRTRQATYSRSRTCLRASMTRSCVPMSTVEKKLEEKSEPIRRIAWVLLPEFALLPFSSAVEPLRAANRILGRPVYEWRIFAAVGRRAEASCGVTFEVEALPPDPGSFDLILVFS